MSDLSKCDNDNPLISVIVPIYNTAKFLPRCIDSILGQTYDDYELILVDDGSTDSSKDICDKYAADRPDRIKVIHKENGGLVSARKSGLMVASGEYISYIDSDDWIESNAYEEMGHICSKYKPQLIDCWFMKEYKGIDSIRKTTFDEGLYNADDIRRKVGEALKTDPPFVYAINSSLCSKLIQRTFLEEFQYDIDEKILLGEDFCVSLQMFSKLESAFFFNKAFYHYCVREQSMTYDAASIQYCVYKQMAIFLRRKIGTEKTIYSDYLIYRLFDLLLDYLPGVPDSYLNGRTEFPFYKNVKKGDQVIIYGKGLHAQNIIRLIQRSSFLKLIANVDSADAEKELMQYKGKYDHILIAIGDSYISRDVRTKLRQFGVDDKKIKTLDVDYISEQNLPEDIKILD